MFGLVPAIFVLLVVILASLLSTHMTARRNALNDIESQAMVVADNTGAGLAFGDRQVVDERFWQADQSTTREHGGLGLGLAIAKEISELHGGG